MIIYVVEYNTKDKSYSVRAISPDRVTEKFVFLKRIEDQKYFGFRSRLDRDKVHTSPEAAILADRREFISRLEYAERCLELLRQTFIEFELSFPNVANKES